MELWIRSQDKTTLIKSYEIYITEQQNKYLIRAKRTSHILGVYNTFERALEVLDEIDEFVDLFNRKGFVNVISDDGIHPKHTIYHMPKE